MKQRNPRSLKRSKARRRIVEAILLLTIFLGAGIGVYIAALYLLPVREVVFIGNRYLKNEEIHTLIKMKKGDALLGVSSQELHQRLRGSPWVKDAVVRKDVSGKIEIKVSEAVPIAILEISDAPSLVDREGIVLEQLRDDAVLLLPVIKDIDPERDKEAYAEAVRFVRFLHDKRVISFNGNIEVTGKRPEDLSIKVDDIIIKVGAGDIERKLQRLKVVIEEIDRKKMAVEYIDIRFENKIIVKSASRHTAVDKKTAAESDEKKKKR